MVTFETLNGGKRFYGYVPLEANKHYRRNAEFRRRVRHVGTIELHGGRYHWWTHDDAHSGVERTLAKAQARIEALL